MARWPRSVFALAALAAVLVATQAGAGDAVAQEDWVIRSFDARYVIDESGTFSVTEDIEVDFGGLERHGIFRRIPTNYEDSQNSTRLINVTEISVSDGSQSLPFETISGLNFLIRIGNPGLVVSGQQRYVISYTVENGLTSLGQQDEMYWNVTGDEWDVTVEQASAVVTASGQGIEMISCFQGPTGSMDPCESSFDETSALFEAIGRLPPGSGLTIRVGLKQTVDPVDSPGGIEGSSIQDQTEASGSVGAVALLAIIAVVALAGASIAIVTLVLIRRRFLRY